MPEYQSLSIVVPTARCINNCLFCVSKQHDAQYGDDLMNVNNPAFARAVDEYRKRLEYARDNGCNTAILTGTGEPTQNRTFLALFGLINKSLEKPFRHITIQSSGALLDAGYLEFLRDHVGVNTVSLSISSLDSQENAEYTGAPKTISLPHLCSEIKAAGMNLRISLNLTDAIEAVLITALGVPQFQRAGALFKEIQSRFGADQITLRKLYARGVTEQAKWTREHAMSQRGVNELLLYVQNTGKSIGTMTHGKVKYDLDGVTVVYDDDCMATEDNENKRYLVLRPNCKLYTKWDSRGSLVF